MSALQADLPFDRVVVTSSGTRLSCTTVEFFALPLHERVKYMLQQELEFYLSDVRIDPALALEGMRKHRAALAKK